MVEFIDGSVLAQLGSAEMRIPIAHTLAYPEADGDPGAGSISQSLAPELRGSDMIRFPALAMARQALEQVAPRQLSSTQPTRSRWPLFSTAAIGFNDIARLAADVLERDQTATPQTIADVIRDRLRDTADLLANLLQRLPPNARSAPVWSS